MEYERIHKVQIGVISPSKLRIKLLGSHGGRKKEGESNSSRSSPSKLHKDMECSMNSLLASDIDEEGSTDASSENAVSSSQVPTLELSVKGDFAGHGYGLGNQTPSFRKGYLLKGNDNADISKSENTKRCASTGAQPTSNFSTVHPLRSLEEDVCSEDSGHENGSTQSFEFYKGEKSSQYQAVSPFFRNLPSKWNDAEKWIVQRQTAHSNSNAPKKTVTLSQGVRQLNPNRMMAALGNMNSDQKHSSAEMRKNSSSSSASQSEVEKFSFASNRSPSSFESTNGTSGLTDSSYISDCGSQSSNTNEMAQKKQFMRENPAAKLTASGPVISVSMRDMGTEMTPIQSQDPSRIGTPIDATTPIRTPVSSIPSSPKGRARGSSSPCEETTRDDSSFQKKEAFHLELQMKTRREIAALGLQLGKMNIASWASKDDVDHTSSSTMTMDEEKALKTEYEDRAAAWEESHKSKYTARYKRKEAEIQAWEDHQREKYESRIRRFEAQIEQRRAQAQEKMIKRVEVTRKRVERRRATAEDKRNKQVARTAKQAEQIRQTGHVPRSQFRFCSWFS